jgi:hypothetical protein
MKGSPGFIKAGEYFESGEEGFMTVDNTFISL